MKLLIGKGMEDEDDNLIFVLIFLINNNVIYWFTQHL